MTEGKLDEFLSETGVSREELVRRACAMLGIDPSQMGTLETANTIVGGRWPSAIIGARRFQCESCMAYVSLAPSSQRVLTARRLKVICMACTRTANISAK